jgi:pSer/pThr/pTyr-binding forkhead associated (FHA) protein
MAQITLTVLSGPAAGSSITREANSKRIGLGRIKTGNAIPLNDPSVSSKHLAVLFRDGSWFVEDLGSTNGTRINDGEGKLLTGIQWQWCLVFLSTAHNMTGQVTQVALCLLSQAHAELVHGALAAGQAYKLRSCDTIQLGTEGSCVQVQFQEVGQQAAAVAVQQPRHAYTIRLGSHSRPVTSASQM